jgi:hypothetical protein
MSRNSSPIVMALLGTVSREGIVKKIQNVRKRPFPHVGQVLALRHELFRVSDLTVIILK